MELTKREIGTLIMALQNSFQDRDQIKKNAKKSDLNILNDINDEFHLLLKLGDEYKSNE